MLRLALKFIEPMKPTLVEVPPKGDNWIHEVKFDGYRSQAHIENGLVTIFTSRGVNWTTKYPTIVEAASHLPVRSAIIDGEMIVPMVSGASDFQAFRRAIKSAPDTLAFATFDLLHLDGEDLRRLPLLERKQRLWDLVAPAEGAIQYSQHFHAGGQEFYDRMVAMELEGMVSKRPDSRYASGRTEQWLKTKCFDEAEFEVAAVLRERGKPAIAYMVDEEHRYVGGAFITLNHALRERLWARVQDKAPKVKPKGMKPKEGAQWLKPGLRARVRFLKGEEELRHATLQELLD